MATHESVPVIDLFAGPGGLGEGFSSLSDEYGNRRFAVRVSIEKDPTAHRTLSLRALFRAFPQGAVPDCYYDYVQGKITREELFAHPSVHEEARFASSEAKCAELGLTPHEEIDGWIEEALKGANDWVLIGGPPCQAYSMAGRSRRQRVDPVGFQSDKRHFLYTEYLRIIRRFGPSVFVMENVKGMLSSRHGGSPIFERILTDLSSPGNGVHYRIRSFVVAGDSLEPQDYVIETERFGVPQNRHRVILFGIRSDLVDEIPFELVSPTDQGRYTLPSAVATVGVKAALSGLPPLRSKLSRETDSHASWHSALKEAVAGLKGWRSQMRLKIEERMSRAIDDAKAHVSSGAGYHEHDVSIEDQSLSSWLHDPRLGGVLQHETRSHMRPDLHRYLFASCFASLYGYSPKLPLFPPRLLPDHGNVSADSVPFIDRFRVQLADYPSSTVVAHIAKDGHYYIHPDPSQARSLTVREVARLQTFPDNYFFEGSRTEQYTQVGNAVPPFLARQIAQIVSDFLAIRR